MNVVRTTRFGYFWIGASIVSSVVWFGVPAARGFVGGLGPIFLMLSAYCLGLREGWRSAQPKPHPVTCTCERPTVLRVLVGRSHLCAGCGQPIVKADPSD